MRARWVRSPLDEQIVPPVWESPHEAEYFPSFEGIERHAVGVGLYITKHAVTLTVNPPDPQVPSQYHQIE